MRQERVIKDRVVQVSLLVIGLNLVAFVLLWRLDLFVHKDLYNYGLRFSFDWITDYWYNNTMSWSLLAGTIVLTTLSLIPKYIYSKEQTKLSRYIGYLLSALALVYQSLSVFFLLRLSSIVPSQLYNFGLLADPIWISTISNLNSALLILMISGLVSLIVPATKNMSIINQNKKMATRNMTIINLDKKRNVVITLD